MRQIYTFTVILLLSTSAFAQSAFFVGIGQDTGKVRDHLESRTYLKSLSEDSLNLWTGKVFKNQELKYRFHDGILYSIEDQRIFTEKEQADLIAESCIKYLKLLDFDTKQIDAPSGLDHYVAITHDQVVEFFMERDRQTDEYTCLLRVTSRRYGPRMKTESFVAQVNAF